MAERAPLSLATRLTAWFTLSTIAVVAGATALLYWALASSLDRQDHFLLVDRLEVMRAILRDDPADLSTLRSEVEWEWSSAPDNHFFARVLDSEGTVVIETPGMPGELTADVFPLPTASDRSVAHRTSGGANYRIMAARAPLGDAPDLTLQLVWEPLPEEALLARFRGLMWLILVLASGLSTIVGYVITRRGIRPIATIDAVIRRTETSTLSEPVAIAGLPGELQSLADTFNAMRGRLARSFEQLETFSANIAHELRTPVANLRGELEVTLASPRSVAEYESALESGLEECERLNRIIDRLLFLARAEARTTPFATETLDVATELATLRDFYGPATSEADVALEVHADAGLTVDADRTLLHRALGNLVDNAIAHTPEGGTIKVAAGVEKQRVWLTVADTGTGMAPEHVERAFDRFYRADETRSRHTGGVGLGLAIVRSIVALHGGTASIDSERGSGTTVTIELPSKRAS